MKSVNARCLAARALTLSASRVLSRLGTCFGILGYAFYHTWSHHLLEKRPSFATGLKLYATATHL